MVEDVDRVWKKGCTMVIGGKHIYNIVQVVCMYIKKVQLIAGMLGFLQNLVCLPFSLMHSWAWHYAS